MGNQTIRHQNVKTAKIKVLHQKPFTGMGTTTCYDAYGK